MRIVRLVTTGADGAGHVVGGGDLGEAFGLGRVLFVTATAEGGGVGQGWLQRGGIGSVARLRPVAGLAGDVGVASAGAGLGLIVVAGDAGVLAGEGYGPGARCLQRTRAVVAVLAERFGDHCLAHEQKDAQGNYEDRHQS